MSDILDEALVTAAFERVPGYLNTATVGLPPRRALETLRVRLDEWAGGTSDPLSYDLEVDRARAAFGRLVGVAPEAVAVVSQVSVVSGMVAASLPAGSVVLCAREDFTSVLFPFLEVEELEVRVVALADLLSQVTDEVDLVAVSAVQSADGVVLDLEALADLASRHRVRTYLDLTQAAGWLDVDASMFDVTACHGYKWLCCPRGAGFMTVSAGTSAWLTAMTAGWYGGEDRWESIYGPPLRLAADARRYDTSPAWFSYSAAAPTLELLDTLGVEAIGRHSVGLANALRSELGVGPSNSTIVTVDVADPTALGAVGIRAAVRAGRVRLSFFAYNTLDDVERAAAAISRT
jgi:selenocysteine lyase/cysteine desulfurase